VAQHRLTGNLHVEYPLAGQPLSPDVEKRVEAMVLALRPVSSVGILWGDTERVKMLPRVADQDLYVLWGEAGEQPALRKIGSVQSGKWVGDASALAPYPQGTPMLIRN